MYKARKKSTPDPTFRQYSLPFGAVGLLEHSLDAAAKRLSDLLRDWSDSRPLLAEKISVHLGRPVTLAQLNAWFAPANRNRIPADVFIAALAVVNNFGPLDDLLAPTGRSVADQRQRDLAEFGQVVLDEEDLASKKAAVRRRLGR